MTILLERRYPFTAVVVLAGSVAVGGLGGGGCSCGVPAADCDAGRGADGAVADARAQSFTDRRGELGNAPGIAQVTVKRSAAAPVFTLAGRDRIEAEGCAPVTEDTRFVSRPFAGLVLGMAFEVALADGLFAEDDPVTSVVPGLTLAHGDAASIRLVDLAAERSGLADGEFWVYTRPCEGDALDDVTAVLAASEIGTPPGVVTVTNEPALTLLALAIQNAAGEPYRDFVAHRIFEPLGMSATFEGEDEYAAGPHMAGAAGVDVGTCPLLVPVQSLALSAKDAAALLRVLVDDGAPVIPGRAGHLFDAGRAASGVEIAEITEDTEGTGQLTTVALDDDTVVATAIGFGHGVFSDLVWSPASEMAVATFVGSEQGTSLPLSLATLAEEGGPKAAPYDHALPLSAWDDAYGGAWVDAVGVGDGARHLSIRVDGDHLQLDFDGEDMSARPAEPLSWLAPNPFAGSAAPDLFSVSHGFDPPFQARVYRAVEVDGARTDLIYVAGTPPFYRQR